MTTKTYLVGLGGRMSREAWVKVEARNQAEAKKAAQQAVPSGELGGAMCYTGVTVKPAAYFLWDWDQAVAEARANQRFVDLTAEVAA